MTCNWTPNEACFGSAWDGLEEWQQDLGIALASATLHRLSGYRVGGCPVTVRPSQRHCCFVPQLGHTPLFLNPGIDTAGRWVNNCGCAQHPVEQVPLVGPVGRVDEVQVDGEPLDPADYRIEGHALVWQGDGVAPWPATQDLSLPDGAAGTFSVTYLNSWVPDSTAQCILALLAEEFAKSLAGKKCRLPSSVTSITRQGISMELVTGAFADGRTGIQEVDAWLALWNPGNLRQLPKVWFPGVTQTVRR